MMMRKVNGRFEIQNEKSQLDTAVKAAVDPVNKEAIKPGCIFERIEKKYLLDEITYNKLWSRMQNYVKVDQYGLNTICNIYYDTDHYDLIRRSLDKPVYKEKLRVRSYGVPGDNSATFVEIKKKYAGVVYKRRIQLKMWETRDYLEKGIEPTSGGQIRKEIDYFLSYYHPIPQMYIAYDRIATYGIDDPELRITFDFRIRSREYDLDLSKGDYGDLIVEPGAVLMEIKIGGAYPLWLSKMLSELGIRPTSFSKYGTAYMQKLQSEEKGGKQICFTA